MCRRVLISVPLLLLALNGCRNDDGPGAAESAAPNPTSTPATSSPATPTPAARTPKLAGPGTNCGEVQPPGSGPAAAVGVLKGHVACSTALAVFRTYYRRDTPKQGSAGVATVRGWHCASNSAAQTNITGRMSTCQTSSTKITADVIP